MDQKIKSTTPQKRFGNLFLFSVLFPTEPEPGVERQEQKNLKSEDSRSAAHILHATSYKSRMSQVRRASLQRRQKPKPAEWNYM